MLDVMHGGRHWCALVVQVEDGVDDGLLAEIASRTGLDFELYGSGGFGGETLADVYEADGCLLMEVLSDEVGAKALFVRADSAERAVAVRDVIGATLPVWSEQMLREQLADTFEAAPEALVALMMAAGGARPDQETLDLLQRALDHEDHNVRVAAEYAQLVAAELAHPPVTMPLRDEPERELDEILRPAQPVDGFFNWVTVRAGEPERTVPRPVTWLRTSYDDTDVMIRWTWDANWDITAVSDQNDEAWDECVHLPRDKRTAMHVVMHEALGSVHIALHGEAAEATAVALVEAGEAERLAGPPTGWEQTRA
jgi:hypothetical protein